MSRYFIDTEFIEGFHKPFLGKRRHFIDLISIGIASEDGRSYYAISKEFDPFDANEWVRENVLKPMYFELCNMDDPTQVHGMYSMWGHIAGLRELTRLIKKYGKTNKQIAQDIQFMCNSSIAYAPELGKDGDVSFYGYYCDYDWVLLCSLFGRMVDLPSRFPMYCRDLKQLIDETLSALGPELYVDNVGFTLDYAKGLNEKERHNALKSFPSFPRNPTEHNALSDAKWNQQLFDFLNML